MTTMMTDDDQLYRRLQQHLDKQAVGFPSAAAGADIRLLKKLFEPEEARLALSLSYKPEPVSTIAERLAGDVPQNKVPATLENMFMKGAIGYKEKSGVGHWFLLPLVVGMYEGQDGRPSREFMEDAEAYMGSMAFGKSFLSVKPSQMRTIPINKSIPVEHLVATYDHIRGLVEKAQGPFVILNCICREAKSMQNKSCTKTSRLETCLGFGDMGAAVLRRKHGREVSREEALAILQQNEADGLVLQPGNAEHPEFVCSCCGCCCGMLGFQKFLPHPVDFWTSNFYAVIEEDKCVSCGKCVSRCQVNAVAIKSKESKAEINLSRCIGCGLCVPTCPAKAIRLKKKETEAVLPKDSEALYDQIMANKPGGLARLRLLFKVALGMRV